MLRFQTCAQKVTRKACKEIRCLFGFLWYLIHDISHIFDCEGIFATSRLLVLSERHRETLTCTIATMRLWRLWRLWFCRSSWMDPKLSVQSFRSGPMLLPRRTICSKGSGGRGPQNVASITCLDTQSAQDVRCVLWLLQLARNDSKCQSIKKSTLQRPVIAKKELKVLCYSILKRRCVPAAYTCCHHAQMKYVTGW